MTTAGTQPIICPNTNCGYRGAPELLREGGVNTGLAALLLLVAILPGLIYIALAQPRYSAVCPQCRVNLGRTEAPAVNASDARGRLAIAAVGVALVLGLVLVSGVRLGARPTEVAGPAAPPPVAAVTDAPVDLPPHEPRTIGSEETRPNAAPGFHWCARPPASVTEVPDGTTCAAAGLHEPPPKVTEPAMQSCLCRGGRVAEIPASSTCEAWGCSSARPPTR